MIRTIAHRKLPAAAARFVVAAALAAAGASATAQDAATRYAQELAAADSFARYNTQIEKLLASQQAEIASLERQLIDIDTTAVEVQPLLQRMFETLEAFVNNDLPFKDTVPGADRQERLQRIRDLLSQEAVSPGEKYRRIMEAYQIEIEYGRTMAHYEATLDDGTEADFVRVGRVSLLYRTKDGRQSGYWDAQQKAWVVNNDYSHAIQQAILIAKKELAPDLVTVPVPAAQEVRS